LRSFELELETDDDDDVDDADQGARAVGVMGVNEAALRRKSAYADGGVIGVLTPSDGHGERGKDGNDEGRGVAGVPMLGVDGDMLVLIDNSLVIVKIASFDCLDNI
jgi:hypothetical protein